MARSKSLKQRSDGEIEPAHYDEKANREKARNKIEEFYNIHREGPKMFVMRLIYQFTQIHVVQDSLKSKYNDISA